MKTKSIEVPKEIFENIFFQEGGEKLHKALTGEYMFENENEEVVNSELEAGEYIQDSEGIRQVDGEKHSNGGVELSLESGTRIISDFLKIGGKAAKIINDEYDLNIKASDTYATVLDKFGKKSGLTEINEELEEYIAKLDKQQKDTKDETTLALNTQYLTEEINEEFKEKEPLEKQREVLFNTLFEMQESSKKEEENKTKFQTGGTMAYNGDPVIEIGKKYGITPDRAKELLSSFKEGGELAQYQNAGYSADDQKVRFNDFLNQARALGYEGDANPNAKDLDKEVGKLQAFMAEKAPDAVINYFKVSGQPMTAKHVDLIKSKYKDAFKKTGISATKPSASYTTEEKNALRAATDDKLDNNFWIEGFKDNKWDWRFPAVATQTSFQTSQGNVPQLVTTPPNVPAQFVPEQAVSPLQTKTQSSRIPSAPATTGFLDLPRSYTLPPSGQTQYARQVAQASTIDPVFISPERQLAEISRQTQSAQSNISMLPDQQAAAAIASVSANSAEAMNKAVSDVNRYNAQAQESANRFNAQLANTTQREQNQLDLTYKNLTEAAKDKTEQDWRNYFNKLSAEDVDRWKTTFGINFENARNPYIQYTPQGYQVTAPDIANNAAVRRLMEAANTPTENLPIKKEASKKPVPKKKTGGRFKK